MKILDLSFLVKYYETLSEVIERIFPEKITHENCEKYNFHLDYKHPNWVNLHFPLLLIMHKRNPGRLRKGSSPELVYQNQKQVIIQMICTADDWGLHYRKNKHKGFSNIVAAIKVPDEEANGVYGDLIQPEKFLNFSELANVYDNSSIELKSLCEVLDQEYPCTGIGQIKMF